MIHLRNVNKYYKTDFWKPPLHVLKDLTFRIRPGVITGFLGENGSGKTSSLKIILGLTKMDSGVVDYGDLGKDCNTAKMFIGFMPERPYFYHNSSGQEYLEYLGKLSGVLKTDLFKRLDYWINRMGLEQARHRLIRTYSKGMLQRLGLVSALVHSPRFLILDEPVSGMDPIGRKEIKDILVELNVTYGTTIFFSTHIIPDVEEICQDIVFIQKGRISFTGPLDHLIKSECQKFNIKYEANTETFSKVVSLSEKDNFIKSVVNSGGRIQSVTPQTPKLENAIYKL